MALRIGEHEKVLGAFSAPENLKALCEIDGQETTETRPILAVVVLHDIQRNMIRADVLSELGISSRSERPVIVTYDRRSNTELFTIAGAIEAGFIAIAEAVDRLALAISAKKPAQGEPRKKTGGRA